MSKSNLKVESSKFISYHGLLPPPSMLREFQGISEEIPHKIIEWANKSLVQIEQNNFKLAVIGFVCTFFLASAFLVLSFCLLYHGETASALIAALPSMAIILTSVFKNLKR